MVMSAGEKKVAVVLVIVLVALVGAYFVSGRSASSAATAIPGQMAAGPTATPTGAPGGQTCAPTGAAAGSVPTQEFGKAGAKVEIVAALPITHGCHVKTEAELKKAYEKHPDDVHLTIYDLFGPEGQAYVKEHGGPRAVVFINGNTSFDLKGKKVKLEMTEGGSYVPDQIVPIIDQTVKGS